MKAASVFDLVGNTPAITLHVDDLPRLHVKLEGHNPTGSVKDRACSAMLQAELRARRASSETRLLDASSGNFGCSLAYFGRALGIPTTIVCSAKLTEEKRAFIEYHGAELRRVGDFTIDAWNCCRELIAQQPHRYRFLDQLHNRENPGAHYRTTGPELLRDFPDLDLVVASLGSGGTLSGVARYLRGAGSRARVVAVEAATGVRVPGTGAFVDGDYVTPFIAQAERDRLIDLRVAIGQEDLAENAMLLLDQGLFCGPQTAAVLAAARIARARWPELEGDCVVISGDAGWKNVETLTILTGLSPRKRSSPRAPRRG